jgi:hypothetical protein
MVLSSASSFFSIPTTYPVIVLWRKGTVTLENKFKNGFHFSSTEYENVLDTGIGKAT